MKHLHSKLATYWAVLVLALVVLAGPGALPARSQAPSVNYSGPLTITKGGTYSGNWESSDSRTPAISINTSEPVVIENSTIKSAGILIRAHHQNNDVTIRNTRGYGLPPTVDNVKQGRFLDVNNFKNIRLEHNYMEQTSGIYLAGYTGDHSANQTVKVLYNKALNLDGRTRNGGWERVQFVQLNGAHSLRGVEVAWNEIINTPNKSYVEDNINFYKSNGTSDSPFLIHDNYIQGAYPAPATAGNHTGGGIILGDGDPSSISDACGFMKCYNNQVVGTVHYGIAVAAGHDIEIYNNRVVSSGYADGQYLTSANVGIYTVNGRDNNANTDAYFFNISVHDNQIGYTKKGNWQDRNDTWFRNIHVNTNNTALPNPITAQTEQAERNSWLEKIRNNNIVPGLIGSTTPTPAPAPAPAPVPAPTSTPAPAPTPAPPAPVNAQFYRAININGSALTLDNNRWEASNGAANVTIKTGTPGGFFSSQNATLTPATDASRAQMIRSSAWSRNVGVEFSNVPNGNYSVYLYIWEDNNSAKFDISVQGHTAQAGVVSGSAGSWAKLGPYAATVTNGILSIAAAGTGDANISGVEIWKASTTTAATPNSAPSINLTAPTNNANLTVGQSQALTASASDADGSVQKVEFFQGTAKLGEVSSAPYQLNWTATTTGTLAFTARATDNAGATTTSAEVTIKVAAALAPAPIPAPAPLPAPFPLPEPVPPVASSPRFYRAININGGALTLDGNKWEASNGAANVQISGNLFSNQQVALHSAPDAVRAEMIRSSVWGRNVRVQLANVPNGTYSVYVYVWEDNNAERYSLSLNDKTILTNYNSGLAGSWDKIGPLAVTVTNGTIQLASAGGDANISGIEVWTAPNGGAQSGLIAANTVLSQAFPNPFENMVTIQTQLKAPETMNVVLFNQVGREVQRRSIAFNVGTAQSRIDVGSLNLPAGQYYLKFISGSLSGKTVKLTK